VPFAIPGNERSLVPFFVVPSNVTDHVVPDGKPVSVNETAYVAGGSAAKAIALVTLPPSTLIVPEEGAPEYPGTRLTKNEYVPFGSAKETLVEFDVCSEA
jgi:hypothetical protein